MNVKALFQTAVTVVAVLAALKLAAQYVPGVSGVRSYVLG